MFVGLLCPSLAYVCGGVCARCIWAYAYLHLCWLMLVYVFFPDVCWLMFPSEGNNGFTQMSYCIVYLQRHPQLVCILSSLWLCSLCGDIAVRSSYLPYTVWLSLWIPITFAHVKKSHFQSKSLSAMREEVKVFNGNDSLKVKIRLTSGRD